MSKNIYILGISAFYHDSAASIILNGNIIAAAQEERFTRKKHDPNFPKNAIRYCLREAKITPDQISSIIFYENPKLKFDRLIKTYLTFAPRGIKTFLKAAKAWLGGKINHEKILLNSLNNTFENNYNWNKKIEFNEHHNSHAASAFYPSPFKNAAILTLDGVGEWATTSISIGNGNEIKMLKEIHFPHSLGLLYSTFTYFVGFKVNSGEYKLMGLAPYGNPRFVNIIKDKLINIRKDGSYKINQNYFDYATGSTMTNKKFEDLFEGPPRTKETKITQREMDLAASIQKVIEEVIILMAKNIVKETGQKNLCLAGGVALNCVANGILLREKIFDRIWIQPAAGDAGGALGAALSLWYSNHKNNREISNTGDKMKGSYLGPSFSDKEIEKELYDCKANFNKLRQHELIDAVTDKLINGSAVGWMQGRMEFGPRALGSRSIIADPRSPSMQKLLNLKIKYRESFRPFAPSVLKNDVNDWFEDDIESPYMLFVTNLNKNKLISINDGIELKGFDKINISRSLVPAITHVDNSARIQTVDKSINPVYHTLISEFKKKTGCPMIVNTSFNVRGEPIVCTPTDAFRCFISTGLDILVIENYILFKDDQKKNSLFENEIKYELD